MTKIKRPSLEQIGRWRQALFETGTMTHEGNRMGGGDLAELYNWLASMAVVEERPHWGHGVRGGWQPRTSDAGPPPTGGGGGVG